MDGQDERTPPVLHQALPIDDSTRNKFARHVESFPENTNLVAGSGIAFADRGERELKGVPGFWRLRARWPT
jgi:hypothetical protein